VLGTFGRGFYVLDDYSALREIDGAGKVAESKIFPVRDALMYEQSTPLGLPGRSFQGDSYYSAENLDPVAIIPFYFDEDLKSLKDLRKEKEKESNKSAAGTAYPSYEELQAEADEITPQLQFIISDKDDNVVKRITQKPKKGINRVKWDLRYNPKDAISLRKPSFYNPFAGISQGPLVAPGTYTVQMAKSIGGKLSMVGESTSFNIKALNNTVMPAKDKEAKTAFQRDVAELSRAMDGAAGAVSEIKDKMKYIAKAVELIESPSESIVQKMHEINNDIKDIELKMYGDRLKARLDMKQPLTPYGRMGWIGYEQSNSTAAPTKTHQKGYRIAKAEFEPILGDIKSTLSKLKGLEDTLEDADAPYTPGRIIKLLQEN